MASHSPRSRTRDDANDSSLRFHALGRRLPAPGIEDGRKRRSGRLHRRRPESRPIDPPDASLRAKWAEKELGRTAADDLPHSPQRERNEAKRVWNEALFVGHRKIAWLTRRSAKEYAGFLDWLWRLGGTPWDMVDLTDVKISHHPKHGPPQPPTLALPVNLRPDPRRSYSHRDSAKPLEIAERRR